MKGQKMLEKIISEANLKRDFQEASYFIVSELEKLIPNWDKREEVILQIEEEYNAKLVY